MILLETGMFLFRMMCLLVPCDPVHKPPEILSVPKSSLQVKRNIEIRSVEPIVKTRAGLVEGYHGKSMNGKDFFAFEGIPYGESTGGPRRWKPPVPKRPWHGVRQAKSPGAPCLQLDAFRVWKVHGSEDCLFLNVYTPNLNKFGESSQKKLPVVVFIHGGAFIFGSSSDYGPSYIMNEDVILVTINYRLGVLGFLTTGDEVVSGNNGLKDQSLALKWVHENIQFFGGDPEKVTLFGNSAGGVSTHLHLISNKTRDYFSNAITSSGNALEYWAVKDIKETKRLTTRFAQTFGCGSDNSRSLVACLSQIDSSMLVAAQFNLYDWTPFPIILFSPVVEPEHPDAFLTVWPEEAYKAKTVAKKPFIAGFNKDEGQSFMIGVITLMKTLPLRVMWDQIAPHYLDYNYVVDDPNYVTKQVSKYYLNGESPRRAKLDVFSEMLSDRFINFGVIKTLQAHTMLGAPTYSYNFSFSDGNHNFGNALGYKASEWGAGHVEDMFYFFNTSLLVDGHRQSDPDHELSQIMVKLLVNFAATGEPTYTSDTGIVHHIWEPITDPSEIKALQFDKKVEMIGLPEGKAERLKFWDSLQIPHMSLLAPL